MFGLRKKHSLEDRIKAEFIALDFDGLFAEIHAHIDAIDAGLDKMIAAFPNHDISEGPSFDCVICLTKAVEDELSGTYDGSLGPIDGVIEKIGQMTDA